VLGELAEMILGSNIYKQRTRMAILLLSIVFRLQNAGKKRQKEGSDGLLRVIAETHSCGRKTATYVACTLSAKNGPTPQHPDPISAIKNKEKVCRMYLRVLL
jgi:hypothetical protein